MKRLQYKIDVFKVSLSEKLASLASRGKRGVINRLCYVILEKMLRIDPSKEYMRDEICDANIGYDPDELERYQKGEIDDTSSSGV